MKESGLPAKHRNSNASQPDKNNSNFINSVRRYLPADFDFGFNLTPSSVDATGIMPVQLSLLRSSLANWTTVTMVMDHVDVCVKNGEMLSLLMDFLGLYFQDSSYGHPGVAAYGHLPPQLKPFGGSDTRLFLCRPHISLFEGTVLSSAVIFFSHHFFLIFCFFFRFSSLMVTRPQIYSELPLLFS